MKLNKAISFSFLFLIIIFIAFVYFKFQSYSPVSSAEVFRADEKEQAERAVENFYQVQAENNVTHYARGAHAKSHGCLKAYFDVNNEVPEQLRQGIFEAVGTRYKAWVRFSNGSSSYHDSNDMNKDARGMAIKVLLPDSEQGDTSASIIQQDFLMHNHPVFFAANVDDYNHFLESKTSAEHFLAGINPLKWKLREFKNGLDTLKDPPSSPLRTRYFSGTAYKLGEHNIKFSASACETLPERTPSSTGENFLRASLIEEVETGDACMQFQVQLQDVSKNMPIEDPSVLWQESDSPFITLAKLSFPQQEFSSEKGQTFCENLSFSPWNALEEHRPIGELNRIRKQVYASSSKFRHDKNQTELPMPLHW